MGLRMMLRGARRAARSLADLHETAMTRSWRLRLHVTRGLGNFHRPERTTRDRQSDMGATRMQRTDRPAQRSPGSSELEFKFTVPPHAAAAVRAHLASSGALQHKLLDAHYFDTEDDRLGAAGLALRLRAQDGAWFQTLKMQGGHGNLQRDEHELRVRKPARGQPKIDLARHRTSAAGELAIEELAADHAPLVERHNAKVTRHVVEVTEGDSVIELSFDEGTVSAGSQQEKISELELELKQGDPKALANLAQRWLTRHGLWLQAESKSDRGRRLARGEAQPPVVKAEALRLCGARSGPAMARAVVANCLQQVLPNMSAIADGSTDAEHVHQLRVGLRRLRTAIDELRTLDERMPVKTEPVLAEVFRALGVQRDQEHVLESITPRLMDAGASGIEWADTTASDIDLAALVRNWRFQNALVEIAGHAFSGAPGNASDAAAAKRLRRQLRPRLARLHERVAKGGRRFDHLDEDAQHRVRKRLKRLRYLSEFIRPLFDDATVERYLDSLKPAQQVLGEHNDLSVARSLAAPGAERDEVDVCFARDWIAKTQRKTGRRAHDKLRKVEKATPFWKKAAAT
jgi:inorganic triphosphatase YgiF